jgi:cellulose synthase operon protein B
MKQLFLLSQISKKAIVVTFCFLLFPNTLLSAKAANSELSEEKTSQGKVTLLAQATPAPTPTTSPTPTVKKDEVEKKDGDVKDDKKLTSHILKFNRSPIVGNSLRLKGQYAESRLGFTRPRGWKLDEKTGTVQAKIRFQHSPALYANRSNLTVLVNGRSVGSAPLNRKQSQVGELLVNIPPNLLQDYNDITMVAQQNDSQECTDPSSPSLWTEILPDSTITFKYQNQPNSSLLNFSHYPYPIFDQLGLETNKVVFIQPSQVEQSWLTSAARFQAALGRVADFRPLETGIAANIASVQDSDRVVILGTPTEQPVLSQLKDLPLKIAGGKILDNNQNPIPEDRGVLILTQAKKDGGAPILIITGNSAKGVAKAAQFLSQPDLRKMGTGQVVFVDKVQETTTPGSRQWARYLPEANSFSLSDLKINNDNKPFKDVTVSGSGAPPIEIDFRALPDDRFVRGSSMNLSYSYGPQINPRTSAVQVFLDGNFIGGARLTDDRGEQRKSLKVDLPANLVTPNSKLQVFFRMNSKEAFDKERCIQPPSQQLSGIVHADTSFDLKRETSVQLPNLELMRFGYPFVAPQDLSATAVVMAQNPSEQEILTLLELSERLGRLSQSDGIKLEVYNKESLPEQVRKKSNLVAIGTLSKFPIPEALKSKGLNLSQAFNRSSAAGAVQTPQDQQGIIKQVVSPWNSERVILALTASSDNGLDKVRQVLNQDPWFFQLKEDTVLISANEANVPAYDPDAFQLAFSEDAPSATRIENTTPLSKASRLIQENWLLLPIGVVGLSLVLYGIVQQYLKRLSGGSKS